ncbi:MAG: MFS transporter [Micropepsaceae bacterium]
MSTEPTPANSQYSWYLAGTGTWFYAFGVQMVMFTYLVTTVLHAPPNQIGLAQTSLTILSAAFMLVGGVVADHMDTRRVLIICHSAAMLPALVLAVIVAMNVLRFEWLIAYGLVMGTITAFMLPAREATLGDVIGPDGMKAVQRSVTTMVGISFLAQIGGMLSARFAANVGAEVIILLQVVAQGMGVYAALKLRPSSRHHAHAADNTGTPLARIRAGLTEVANSTALFPVTVLTLAIGVLFIGSFMVILPVILREEFGGNVQQISSMQAAFWGGTIVSSFVIGRIGHIVHRGRLIVGAVTTGATILTLISIPAPLYVLYGLVFVWGLGAGVMISMSRTTVQEHAPPALRARVLSIFQLGFTGGMSVGALVAGLAVSLLGARHATLVPACAMAIILATLVARTDIWNIKAIHQNPDSAS